MINPQLQLRQNIWAAIAHGSILNGNNWRRKLFGLREGEDPLCHFLRRRDKLHPLKRFHTRLRLFGFGGLGFEAIDKTLQMLALRRLLFRGSRLHGAFRGAGFGKCIIIALVEGQLLVLEMQDPAHRAIEQVAVVADHHHSMRIARQKGLEPDGALKIEIVGRLIQQQKIWCGKQNRRQGHPHAPTARKIRAGAFLRGFIKAQSFENGRGAPFGGPGINIGQTGLHLGYSVGIFAGIGQKRRPLDICGQDRIEQRQVIGRGLLRHAANLGPTRQFNRAAFQGQFSADNAKKRGFSGAIGADKAHFMAGGNGRTGALKQAAAIDGIGDVLDFQHGPPMTRSAAKVNPAGRSTRSPPPRPWP